MEEKDSAGKEMVEILGRQEAVLRPWNQPRTHALRGGRGHLEGKRTPPLWVKKVISNSGDRLVWRTFVLAWEGLAIRSPSG